MIQRIVALAALLFGCVASAASPAPTNEPLAGLWAAEIHYPIALSGSLVVERVGRTWRARIAGASATTAMTGRDIRLAFPRNAGGFRGELSADGLTLTGFWLQPVSGVGDKTDPGGFGQPFATPVTMVRIAPNRWRGTVVPLDAHFTLYLKIFAGPDGAVIAAFRNPESNLNGGAQQFHMTRSGDAITFSIKYDGREIKREATLVGNPERIRLTWSDLPQTVELTRVAPEQAAAFFPRPPNAAPYIYRMPRANGDGWRTSRAATVGIDESALTKAVRIIAEGDPAGRPASLMHSMLVARHGRLVLEEYFFGYNAATPHDMRSAGKTFASVMLGAEMLRRAPIGPETRIYDLMGGVGRFANPDPRKATITLRNLLTHNAGLACNDNDDNSPGNEGTMQNQTAQPNWWKYTLDLPMAYDPGTRYAYCSANINLAGAALTTATRTWLPRLFARDVAEPLQFGRWYWNLMPTGEGYQGGGAFIRPRDLLKIGQVYLDGGVWNGRRIVTADWTKTSTTPIMPVTPASTGLSAEEFGNYYGVSADALAWHKSSITVAGRTIDGYDASGNGGQLLIVYPSLDLTVVFTGGNYMQGGIWGKWGQRIIGDLIVPSLRD